MGTPCHPDCRSCARPELGCLDSYEVKVATCRNCGKTLDKHRGGSIAECAAALGIVGCNLLDRLADCELCDSTRCVLCQACRGVGCAACEGDGDRPCPRCNSHAMLGANVVHGRGIPGLGPATMCGGGEAPTEAVVEVTCPRCISIVSNVDVMGEWVELLAREHGRAG